MTTKNKDRIKAVKTNKIFKDKFDAAIRLPTVKDIVVKLEEIILEITNSLEKEYPNVVQQIAESTIPRSYEDVAVLNEWLSILLHHRHTIDPDNDSDCKLCHTTALGADDYRLSESAKNPELFYPILGEKFASQESQESYKRAIECYKKAGGAHKKRLNELIKKAGEFVAENQKLFLDSGSKKKKKSNKGEGSGKKKGESIEEAEKSGPVNEEDEMSGPVTKEEAEKSEEKEEKSGPVNVEAEKSGPVSEKEAEKSEEKEEAEKSEEKEQVQKNGDQVWYSLLKPTEKQINGFGELTTLCSKHMNLVSVFHLTHSSDGQPSLMVERVVSIKDYFEAQLTNKCADFEGLLDSKMWWDHIHKEFQLIFRDVIQGLIYLYRTGKVCGNLSDNIFVSAHTHEGRILPSLDPSHNKDGDACELVDVMTSIIALAHKKFGYDVNNLSVMLPAQLVHFFDFVRQDNTGVHMSILIDHPYFWNIEERVLFAYKWHRVVKRERLDYNLEDIASTTNVFNEYSEWWQVLTGRYKSIYDWGKQFYENHVHIVRFCHAAYSHVNDSQYRGGDEAKFRDADIEEDLTKFFPNYYIDMFEAFCACVPIRGQECMGVITNFRFNDSGFRTELITKNWDLGVAMAARR